MSKLIATRTTQFVQMADFTFNYSDWVVDSAAPARVTLGATVAVADPGSTVSGLAGAVANTVVFDAIPLPIGAVITGGEVIVETAYAGATAATLSVGIAGATTALASAVDLKTAARTALTLTTPLLATAGQNIRLTLAYTVANATAGKVRVRVQYTIDGKMHETCIV
jgi:hypothetical protein